MIPIVRTDVTAVKLYSNYILAGIGSTINVFDKEYMKLLQRIYALKGQKIYGFVHSDFNNKILVFGGKQFTVATVQTCKELESNDDVLVLSFEPVVCDDWIHSAVWIHNNAIALLTAHNVVQKWDTLKQKMISQHESKENSILYSGLLLPLQDDVLVFAGTVFSEVIVHRCGNEKPLHYLKGHRGVIFSISCDLQKEIIVTTSDDRSVRIWCINNTSNHTSNSKEYWENVTIVCKHEAYGHTARVMRNCITQHGIVSVGEDSAICFWDFKGKLLKKTISHQNGCIWSVDASEEHLVTGGGDCSVILHPLTVALDYGDNDVLNLSKINPKKIIFTARRNIIILSEDNDLIYYDVMSKSLETVCKLNHESTYKLLSISSCKQILAVADMCGNLDVFIEHCKDVPCIQSVINTKLKIGKILSMQWIGNRHLVFCCENGIINVLASKGNETEMYANFVLPSCKERFLTSSAMDSTNNMLVFGDRCGNIHFYVKGKRDPVKTFSKIHGRYGPTSIVIRDKEIVTTGRDGTIKYFSILNNDGVPLVKYMTRKDLEFQWVERFLDKSENLICGFQERVFVVDDVRNNSRLLEVPCGGGHRSWDAIRYFDKINSVYEECISLIYVKNADVHVSTFQLSKIVSKNIINGSHSKEINCLKALRTKLDNTVTYYISGGEDTTLRVSSINPELQFQDEVIFKHLSSVKTLKTFVIENERILLVSAGGRAQICIKLLQLIKDANAIRITAQEVIDHLVRGTDRERKGNQTWRNCSIDFDPETRIMDIDLIQVNQTDFMIFAGCSDAWLRIFKFDSKNACFHPVTELKHHKTCILKTQCIKFKNKDMLATCSTRSEVAFWDISDVTKLENLKPFFVTLTNKSGINSFSYTTQSDKLLVGTGGDDNAIYLTLLEIPEEDNLNSMLVSHIWTFDKFHSSQITGLSFVENYLVSASIDQRVTLCEWKVNDGGIECNFLKQVYSDVADIQGMDLLDCSGNSITVCVYGKGMEVMTIDKPS